MANYTKTTALTCLWALASAISIAASPAEIESPDIIVLRGDLESKKLPDLPAEPEKTPKVSRKIVVYALKLPMPIPARGLALPADASDPQRGFQELRLVCDDAEYPECEATLKKSVGHPIRVVGKTARPAQSNGHLLLTMHVRLITVLQ